MTTYKITAPVQTFDGVVADVVFNKGLAVIDVDHDARIDGGTNLPKPTAALAYFKRKGYGVEEVTREEAAEALADALATPGGTPNTRAVTAPGVPSAGATGTDDRASQIQTPADPGATITHPDQGDGTKPPAKSAGKGEWVKYATEHGGMAKADADKLSRDELADKYSKESK